MLTLGIDTSNYATSLAVFDTNAGEVVCDCKKFLPVKAGQLGLRQSDALFHHTAALPDLLAELGTKADLTQIGAVGVSAKPRPVEGSYMPCFLAGVNAAAAFALGKGIPLIHTTHQQGHIAAALFATGERELFEQENLVFHVSGGTTDLLLCQGAEHIRTRIPVCVSRLSRRAAAMSRRTRFRTLFSRARVSSKESPTKTFATKATASAAQRSLSIARQTIACVRWPMCVIFFPRMAAISARKVP